MNYSSILDYDLNNGEGVRVSLWLTGCPHHCKGCHNEALWNPETGKKFTAETLNTILTLLDTGVKKDLSILGGEPLAPYNRDVLNAVLFAVKAIRPETNIWVWTGYMFEEIVNLPVLQHIDVLIDGRFEQDKADKNLMWRGSSNQRIIDLKASQIGCSKGLQEF